MVENKICITGWILVIINLMPLIQTVQGQTIYVDDNATGANDGTTWGNAYQYLQDALANSRAGNTICVAEGIYRPDQGKDYALGDRDASFKLKSGVRLIGGYAGLKYNDPDARNIHEYQTILSGDMLSNDMDVNDPRDLLIESSRSDNSYHVVTTRYTNETAVLDGFTISGGNADSSLNTDHKCGGGLYNSSGSPQLVQCTFSKNSARFDGGAILNRGGNFPILLDCVFHRNASSSEGGGAGQLGK